MNGLVDGQVAGLGRMGAWSWDQTFLDAGSYTVYWGLISACHTGPVILLS